MLRQLKRLILGLVIGLLGILASLLPMGRDLEEGVGLYWLFHLRGAIRAPDDVVVVAIDQQSAKQLGLSSKPSEWPRNLHARLIQNLTRAGAQVIAFDLTFDTASRLPQHDQEFAAAISEAGNVLLVAMLKRDAVPLTGAASHLREQQIPPIPILERAALAYATFPLPRASRVNAYWTFKTSAGDSPTLPVLALQTHALQAYGEFLGLWNTAEPPRSVALPPSRQAIIASNDIEGLMLKLRSTFMTDPRLADRMLQQLEKASDQDVDQKKKRIIKSVLNLYAGDEVRYLNFYGPPRSVTTVPYHQVLQATQSEPGAFKGKAVFVGFSASSQPEQDRIRDDYQTVFSQPSGLDISGVEIAATAFANLLEDRPVRPMAFPWQLGLILLWGLILGAVCRMLRPVYAVVLVGFLTSVYLAVSLHQFTTASLWLPLFIPLCLQGPLALFGGALLNYRDARREREIIKRAFGYFLPRHVVDQLAKSVGPITSTNQLVHGVCLATDAQQYTTLAEKMDPRELSRLMNDYYAVLFAPVDRHGGIVSDVVGDSMLAIWAASSAERSLRAEACQASLEIAEAIARFNQEDGRPALHTRIGLHFGQMLVGSVGAVQHYEYRAVGDIVNTSTRIEGLNKHLGTRLLASEAAVEGLEDILTRPLGSFLLAGKANPVRVFELLDRQPAADDRRHWLCEKFAAALETYGAQNWCEAADKFREILQSFPADGPSRFYLVQCERYVANPPADPWEPTVPIQGK